ncbi:MAG TPA: tlde1 domain-containing protein [Bradyrhizobium sp.]|jgi:hypothetical protein|uniref:DUF2778 domain-containing protein n=1 Tax=Bradyrhizobium sp. TaxID=376 RepID=UPI002BCFC6B4|nr:tlde1 domain-containing protein [Bradyrhizobium sp.]HTB03101.1 tlde1 domain-containing protein [Bradyrhizobium sp.]
MSKSTGALAARKRKSSSRKAISHNLLGGAALACLVLASGWTVYSNILSASVYPMLGSAGFDEPVVKRPPVVAARGAAPDFKDRFASLSEPPVIAKPATVSAISATQFNERFAAAEPQSVASAVPAEPAAAPAQKIPAPKLAEAPKPVSAPKLAEAPKQKDTPPAQVALNVPPPPSTPAEARPAKSGSSIRDMAQRAKAAVMSIASSEKLSITEKLWGKQPSHGSLLAYASADASITGSIGHEQNPALGGSAPYDRDTAVYDISAHTVYLPDGSKLEAHSGLGSDLDDPRSARVRMRGVTPPHIYELKPREALFHGVPALRLTPIGGEDAIYGRSGLLAHTFMLGPNGDSNGCVSFRDYNAFLNAYRNQGIKRLAVVAKVE